MPETSGSLIEDLGKIIVFLLLLLAVYLLTTKSRNKRANFGFAGFLIVLSFDFSGIIFPAFFKQFPVMDHLRNASAFLQMPLLYWYVKKTCYTNEKLSVKQLWQLIPFLVFFMVLIGVETSRELDILYILATQAQYYGYLAAIFVLLRRFRKIYRENYSLHNDIYKWLFTTSLLFLIANSMVLLRLVFQAQQLELLNILIFSFALISICWFVLKTMRNPHLFMGIDGQLKPLTQPNAHAAVKEHQQELATLSAFMTQHKPYLDSALTLQGLAEQTEIPEKQLSFLINKVLGTHFYDYINTFRIEESKLLLKDDSLNIQQIMYQVGFNSKSSFNTAFKKQVLQTPTQYRKSIG